MKCSILKWGRGIALGVGLMLIAPAAHATPPCKKDVAGEDKCSSCSDTGGYCTNTQDCFYGGLTTNGTPTYVTGCRSFDTNCEQNMVKMWTANKTCSVTCYTPTGQTWPLTGKPIYKYPGTSADYTCTVKWAEKTTGVCPKKSPDAAGQPIW
jgi:hypothetical protein